MAKITFLKQRQYWPKISWLSSSCIKVSASSPTSCPRFIRLGWLDFVFERSLTLHVHVNSGILSQIEEKGKSTAMSALTLLRLLMVIIFSANGPQPSKPSLRSLTRDNDLKVLVKQGAEEGLLDLLIISKLIWPFSNWLRWMKLGRTPDGKKSPDQIYLFRYIIC